MQLFEACARHLKPLEFYGRYDHTVPVDPAVLKWFLDKASPNYHCKLVPDILHSKVIWWVDAGAYIGSANLSDRAWISNIEAGVFLPHDELAETGMERELLHFFEEVDDRSVPLREEIYLEQRQLADRMCSFRTPTADTIRSILRNGSSTRSCTCQGARIAVSCSSAEEAGCNGEALTREVIEQGKVEYETPRPADAVPLQPAYRVRDVKRMAGWMTVSASPGGARRRTPRIAITRTTYKQVKRRKPPVLTRSWYRTVEHIHDGTGHLREALERWSARMLDHCFEDV
ncbi:MAG: hypothetical protein KatS3mg122_2156 [Caldimonas sp.]|nr:MAG: hypothetical protein KatS3mg122_2156 [Caldimonas sp.]